MLDLDTCQKLKEAGLEWDTQLFDLYYRTYNQKCSSEYAKIEIIDEDELQEERCNGDTFCPRLDQILTEIKKLGYDWKLVSIPFQIQISDKTAADTLLWILNQERKDK